MLIAPCARKDVLHVTLIFILAVALLCWLWPGLWPLFVATLALVWVGIVLFFRDPERSTPSDPRALVAPADGKVVEISEDEEPHFLGKSAHKLAIFMSVFDVHVNRSPCRGRVVNLEHRPGRFLGAMRAEASLENEANLISLHNSAIDEPVLLKQIAGLVARRVVCTAKAGEALRCGQRIGMVKLGSRAEVFVGRDRPFRWRVKLGDKVRAGVTIVGEWTE